MGKVFCYICGCKSKSNQNRTTTVEDNAIVLSNKEKIKKNKFKSSVCGVCAGKVNTNQNSWEQLIQPYPKSSKTRGNDSGAHYIECIDERHNPVTSMDDSSNPTRSLENNLQITQNLQSDSGKGPLISSNIDDMLHILNLVTSYGESVKLRTTKEFSNDIRQGVALLGAIGTPFHKIGEILTIVQSMQFFGGKSLEKPINKSTSMRILVEFAIAIEYFIAMLLSHSTDIYIAMDGATTIPRRFLTIMIGGVFQHSMWCLPLRILETLESTGEAQAQFVISELTELKQNQKDLNMQQITLYDLKSITFDNCSSNTGEKNGLIGVLQRKRREIFQSLNLNTNYENLVAKGCGDHILCLASKSFQRRLIDYCSCTIPTLIHTSRSKKQVVTTWLLNYLSTRLRKQWKAVFDAFVQRCHLQHITIQRTLETRYLTYEIMALTVIENYMTFVLFLQSMAEGSSCFDEVAYKLLLDPYVIVILKVMGGFAKNVLLPMMREFPKTDTVLKHKKLIASYFSLLQLGKTIPLYNQTILSVQPMITPELHTYWKMVNETNSQESDAIKLYWTLNHCTTNVDVGVIDESLKKNFESFSKLMKTFPNGPLSEKEKEVLEYDNEQQESNDIVGEVEGMGQSNCSVWEIKKTIDSHEFQQKIEHTYIEAIYDMLQKHEKTILMNKEADNLHLLSTTRLVEQKNGGIKNCLLKQVRTNQVVIDARIKCAAYFNWIGLKVKLFQTFSDVGLKRQARHRLDTSPKSQHFNQMALEKAIKCVIKKRGHLIKNKEESVKESAVISLLKTYQFIHEEDIRITVATMKEFLKLCKEHFKHITLSGNRADLFAKIQNLISDHENEVVEILKQVQEKNVETYDGTQASQSSENVDGVILIANKNPVQTRKRAVEYVEEVVEAEQESQVLLSQDPKRVRKSRKPFNETK